MVLHPLEFAECYLDSPSFRSNIQQYEEELETTNTQIKQLIKDAKNMLIAFSNHEKMMKIFSNSLQQFPFDLIGENLTDVERGIAESLNEFGIILEEIATDWSHTIKLLNDQIVLRLEEFRSDHICSYRDAKKNFEKTSERYYKQLDHTLALSHKKKEHQLQEADNELLNMKRCFHEGALKYVYKLQEIEERKKFEFVEHLLMFMQIYFNYFHQTHETAVDWKHYMTTLQTQLVTTREQYDGTRDKTDTLMKKMMAAPDSEEFLTQVFGHRWSRGGYLMLMEKGQRTSLSSRFSSKWSKYFCMYKKENKIFRIIAAPHTAINANSSSMGAKVASSIQSIGSGSQDFSEDLIMLKCTRRMTESLDRRFCFDVELEDSNNKQYHFTLQALSEEDMQKWIAVMDGKEPDYMFTKIINSKEELCKLNEVGLQMVTNLVAEIERRGVHHEGIYRLVGVTSKVDLLLQNALTAKTAPSVNYSNESDWETNTLTSALKCYFRNLPEPIMTYDLHRQFIDAAKCENPGERVQKVSALINQLPEINRKMIAILSEHLYKVQEQQEINKMTVQNLGVCFGPTLLREKQETVHAIFEIKFCNIIVEILIKERRLLFGSTKEQIVHEKSNSDEDNTSSPRIYTKTLTRVAELPSSRSSNQSYSLTTFPHFLESGERRSPLANRLKAIRVGNNKPLNFSLKEINLETSSSSEGIEADDGTYAKLDNVTSPGKSNKFRDDDGNYDHIFNNDNIRSSSKSPAHRKSEQRILKLKLSNSGDHLSQDTRSSPRNRTSQNISFKGAVSDDKTNRNANNSNIKPPAVPVKPAEVTETFKNKLLSTVKHTKPVRRFPANDKLIKTKSNEVFSKTVLRSKSDVKNFTPISDKSRRPKSEFVPSAFLVEESDLVTGFTKANSKRPQSPLFETTNVKSGRSSSVKSQSSDSSAASEFIDDDIPSSVARTLFYHDGDAENKLSFRPGQLIRNIRKSNEPGWLLGNLNGKVGLVPRNYVDFA